MAAVPWDTSAPDPAHNTAAIICCRRVTGAPRTRYTPGRTISQAPEATRRWTAEADIPMAIA